MSAISTLISCAVVSLIWGTTNVLIKRSTKEITKVKANSWFERLFNDFKYLAVNWKYLLPFFINQLGSVLFYFILLYSELSLAVPVTNALTFLFTAAASTYCGETVPSRRTVAGSIFVLTGITLCVIGKLNT